MNDEGSQARAGEATVDVKKLETRKFFYSSVT